VNPDPGRSLHRQEKSFRHHPEFGAKTPPVFPRQRHFQNVIGNSQARGNKEGNIVKEKNHRN
jgi:hypothetical protein